VRLVSVFDFTFLWVFRFCLIRLVSVLLAVVRFAFSELSCRLISSLWMHFTDLPVVEGARGEPCRASASELGFPCLLLLFTLFLPSFCVLAALRYRFLELAESFSERHFVFCRLLLY
jgi:hypothetical protein